MFTLEPPSRLGRSLANAVIDMESSNVFLSTVSPVVILWGTSFQHSGLYPLWFLSVRTAWRPRAPQGRCGLGIKAGKGGGSWGVMGEGAGSCLLNSISLSHYPVVHKLHPFIFMVATSEYTAKAGFLCTFYFLVFLGFSFRFTKNHWHASEKGSASRNWS